ncbi:MAG: hypothetical protein Q7S35_05105 [Candidatus Limnocylindrales bacterium]|nr:hypothetical protein [Candidatus Limnocylindrales bacterium]
MTGTPADGGSRDIQDVDALITDRYLESILAAHGRGADTGPTLAGARLDPNVRMAAEHLARDLPRLHPSFRFEEALARKLGEAAARMRLPLAAGGERVIVPLAGRSPFLPVAARDDDDRFRLRADPRLAIGRPLLIGGALTSAALSLAGAAYVAWRIRHPQTSPMARAVRAVARTRLA